MLGCIFLVALAEIVSAAYSGNSTTNSTTKPHILFILQDDLGHYDIGFSDHHSSLAKKMSPTYTTLAEEGLVLDRHYTHYHCSPSRRSFLTGRLPVHHGETLSTVDSDDIDLRYTWISEKLKAAGYGTYMFGKGHTGYKSMGHLPVNKGFDQFFGFLPGSGSYRTLDRWNNTGPAWKGNTEYSTDVFGAAAVEALKQHNPEIPMFMYLPWQAVHDPYNQPDQTFCENELYNILADCDLWVSRLVDQLKKSGMYENTLIVFSSDNGGTKKGNNYPYRGEKKTNYEGGLRTVTFAAGGFVPEHLRGTRTNLTVHISDWYPTFCGLAGVDFEDPSPVKPLEVDPNDPTKDIYGTEAYPNVDGVDVWKYLTNPSDFNTTDAAHETLVLTSQVILKGDYKLVTAQPYPFLLKGKKINVGWKDTSGNWSHGTKWPCDMFANRSVYHPCLFNLADDPREMINLNPTNKSWATPLVDEMWAQLNLTLLTNFSSRSPAYLLGVCNRDCATTTWSGVDGPVCGVPGCTPPPQNESASEYGGTVAESEYSGSVPESAGGEFDPSTMFAGMTAEEKHEILVAQGLARPAAASLARTKVHRRARRKQKQAPLRRD